MYCSPLYIHQPSIDVKAEQNGFVGLNVSTTLCSSFVVNMLYFHGHMPSSYVYSVVLTFK